MNDAALLGWYDANKRAMPWRRTKDPYRIWLSEVMLQQTTVATVIGYFERFLERFPDVRALARADEADVLRLWAGLGYYSRARNLHRAAKAVVEEHAGRFPRTLQGLRSLPGVGRYTAAAVASIAFGLPAELVDGNVIRVYARLFALRGDPRSPALQEKVWTLAAEHLDHGRPGDWNQALMELGATVCSPVGPECGRCPLSKSCLARKRGLQDSIPVPAARKETVRLSWTALLARRGSKVLLWRRASGERFLPGHWALPEARHIPDARPGKVLRRVTHSITHHRIALSVREAAAPARLPKDARWVDETIAGGLLVSSLWTKALGLAAAAAVLGVLMAVDASASPVVVELFTSQGCSSCPDADALVSRWGKTGFERGELLPLTYDVDYWNYLGWRDLFSTPEYTRRQRDYAAALKVTTYTPQMVVAGRTAFVGSDEVRAREAADRWRAAEPGARIAIASEPSSRVRLAVTVEPLRKPEAGTRLMLALFENGLETKVTSGENGGRTLRNDFVVRRLMDLGALPADGKAFKKSVDAPWDPAWRKDVAGAAVFLQDPRTRAIGDAASLYPLR